MKETLLNFVNRYYRRNAEGPRWQTIVMSCVLVVTSCFSVQARADLTQPGRLPSDVNPSSTRTAGSTERWIDKKAKNEERARQAAERAAERARMKAKRDAARNQRTPK